MKGEWFMEADVRVIRLIRKTIWNKDDSGNTKKTGTNDYFATDYFDIMRVEKKKLASPLTSIMGMWPYREMGAVDIAVHSYSLYLGKEMTKLTEGKKKCGDPFEDPTKRMPFLSIIQVHITPEILVRRPKEESAEHFVDVVYQDLLSAVEEYAGSEEHRNETFVYCVYKMLSAGDFAVVVRSEEPEISFSISTLLRRRVTASKEIVLYKTYTIFTFGDEVIGHEMEERSVADAATPKPVREDRFVLRCCYSNLYWSNKEEVDKYLKNESLHFEDKLYGLNGRYDFSVRVTKKQFFELFQDIKAYKQIETRGTGSESKAEKRRVSESQADDIVKYMRYLMDNHYLSYINERYLMVQDENSETSVANSVSKVECTETDQLENVFLDQRIADCYNLVKEKYERVCSLIKIVAVGSKNMNYYMDLLGKQINLYYGINGFSDTRIYAAALLEQLNVILGSIVEYIDMYDSAESTGDFGEEDERGKIRNLLEDYIRQSVCVLDHYAQHIRSRNLQSLQTPNYNIESGMSQEKMLIGYSEFIKVFMDFYLARKGEMDDCEYFPIVVPALNDKDVSVKNLFAIGMMNDWRKEKEIRGKRNAGLKRSCIIISVPTLMELGDVRTMAASLIHEMAHQFRYETRKERNDALLQHLIRCMMREVMNALIQNIQNEMGIRDWNIYYGRMLEGALIEAYMEVNYENEDGNLEYDYQNAPYNNFTYCFGKDFYDILGSWGKRNEIKAVFRAFLRKLMQHYQLEYSRCPDAIKILEELTEKMEQRENGKDLPGSKEEGETIVRCAYALSYDCARQKMNIRDACIWEDMGFENWIKDEESEEIEIEYADEWERAFEQGMTGNDSKKELLGEIYQNFANFANWVYDNCGNYEKVKPFDITKKTEFLKIAYQKMCRKWNEKTIQDALDADYDSVLSVIGRALGIDLETHDNEEIFVEKITTVVMQNLESLDKMTRWRIGKYREETADMFMCNVMDLTPFGYMYQLAVGWLKDRELPNEYYSRSQHLLLFQWCLEKQGDRIKLSHEKYRKLCVDLAKTLRKAIDITAKRLIAQGVSLEPLDMDAPVQWDAEDSIQCFEMQDRMTELTEYCSCAMRTCKSAFIEEEYTMLRLYRIMAHMMEQLIGSVGEHLDYLEEFYEIRDDYITGIGVLKGLNEEMCRAQGETGEIVSKLGRFCKEMGRWQNEPYKILGDEAEKEQMNARSIEFLLDMYYENKRRIAQQVGGEKCL